jgi:hypothetical protein
VTCWSYYNILHKFKNFHENFKRYNKYKRLLKTLLLLFVKNTEFKNFVPHVVHMRANGKSKCTICGNMRVNGKSKCTTCGTRGVNGKSKCATYGTRGVYPKSKCTTCGTRGG